MLLACSCEVHQSAISSKFSASKVVCGCSDEYCEQAMDSFRLLCCLQSVSERSVALADNASEQTHICYHGGYDASVHSLALANQIANFQKTGQGCDTCPVDLIGDGCCLAEVAYPWSAPGSWYRESQLIASVVLPSCLRMLLQAETKWSACSGESGHTFLSQRTICSAIVVQKCWLVLQVSR